MTPTEKLLMLGYGIMSGIAIYYIHKCSNLEKCKKELEDKIDFLNDYITECIQVKEGFLDD